METMLEYEFMRLENEGKLAWLTFTRKNHLNALNNACIDQIGRIARMLREASNVRLVIIRGEGRAFCTGIDLKELAANQIEMDYHHRWEQSLHLFETMEKLIMVGMHGYCLGGALQLALAADIRISTSECQLGLPAIKESLIPGLATMRLPRYIGWGRAKKMILGGKNIDGREALRIGLVDHIVPQGDFFAHLDQIAGDYLSACSLGTRMSKLVTNQAFDLSYETILQYYFELQQRAQLSPDAEEAKRAYLNKREPKWQ